MLDRWVIRGFLLSSTSSIVRPYTVRVSLGLPTVNATNTRFARWVTNGAALNGVQLRFRYDRIRYRYIHPISGAVLIKILMILIASAAMLAGPTLLAPADSGED